MYEDRIEILSPGALYGPNKIEKLGTDNMMEVRNPTIVKILEEKGSVIENRHSGIPTMKREMSNYNLPMPEFYNERGSFKVVFKNSLDLSGEQVSVQVSEQVSNFIFKYKELLEYCKNPKSAKEIRKYLNIKNRNYVNSKILKPLIQLDLLEYTNKSHVKSSNQKYITKIRK